MSSSAVNSREKLRNDIKQQLVKLYLDLDDKTTTSDKVKMASLVNELETVNKQLVTYIEDDPDISPIQVRNEVKGIFERVANDAQRTEEAKAAAEEAAGAKGGKSKKRSAKSKSKRGGGDYNLPAMANTEGLMIGSMDPINGATVHVGTLVNTPSPFSAGINTDFNDSTRHIPRSIINNIVPSVGGPQTGGRRSKPKSKRA